MQQQKADQYVLVLLWQYYLFISIKTLLTIFSRSYLCVELGLSIYKVYTPYEVYKAFSLPRE